MNVSIWFDRDDDCIITASESGVTWVGTNVGARPFVSGRPGKRALAVQSLLHDIHRYPEDDASVFWRRYSDLKFATMTGRFSSAEVGLLTNAPVSINAFVNAIEDNARPVCPMHIRGLRATIVDDPRHFSKTLYCEVLHQDGQNTFDVRFETIEHPVEFLAYAVISNLKLIAYKAGDWKACKDSLVYMTNSVNQQLIQGTRYDRNSLSGR